MHHFKKEWAMAPFDQFTDLKALVLHEMAPAFEMAVRLTTERDNVIPIRFKNAAIRILERIFLIVIRTGQTL